MSIKLCFPTNCKKLEIDFFLSVGDPPEASKLESKNKFKSPLYFFIHLTKNHQATYQAHKRFLSVQALCWNCIDLL